MLNRRQCVLEFLHHSHAVVILGAISDAIASNEHLGLNLFEAIEHGQRTHVGRTNAPYAAHTHSSQKSHDGFWNIGQVSGHTVARLKALCFEVQGHGGHLALQLGP